MDGGPRAPTSRNPVLGFVFFASVTALVGVGLFFALYWNRAYLLGLVDLPSALGAVEYGPIAFDGLGGVLLGFAQTALVGSVLHGLLFARYDRSVQANVLALGLGFGHLGLVATLLSLARVLALWSIELAVLGTTAAALLLAMRLNHEPLRAQFRGVVGMWAPRRLWLSGREAAVFLAFLIIFGLLLYQSAFYPVVETDSLIYHSTMAAVAYHHGGLPWIVGGGVGLGSSANYPNLYSYVGASLYHWSGGVHDLYLRIAGAFAGLLAVATCGLIGEVCGGRRVGVLAAILALSVPSFASYATLASPSTVLVMFGALGFFSFLQASRTSNLRWWIACGLFLGFGCLTSYQGLYVAAPLGVAFLLRFARTKSLKDARARGALVALLFAGLVAGAPYVRNAVLLGNPTYPFLDGVFHSRYVSGRLLEYNQIEWYEVSRAIVNVAPSEGDWLTFLLHLGSHPAFLPLNLAMAIPMFAPLLFTDLRFRRDLVLFFSVPTAVMLIGPVVFVRYLWLLIPFVSVGLAGVVVKAAEWTWPPIAIGRRIPSWVRHGAPKVPVVLAASFLVMPTMVGLVGNSYSFIYAEPPRAPLHYFTRPGIDPWTYLRDAYGSDVDGWEWLNANVKPGERIASLEARVYYIRPAVLRPETMLYLDGLEAEPLFEMRDPADIAEYLRSHGVEYVFVRIVDWTGLYAEKLPLFSWLGSQTFPRLFVAGLTVVYGVADSPPWSGGSRERDGSPNPRRGSPGRLEPRDDPAHDAIDCRPLAEGEWG